MFGQSSSVEIAFEILAVVNLPIWAEWVHFSQAKLKAIAPKIDMFDIKPEDAASFNDHHFSIHIYKQYDSGGNHVKTECE